MVYEAELRAVKTIMPEVGRGLEIGVGAGRFACPVGIRDGIEPSKRMRALARKRRVRAIEGMAEDLPYDDSQFDFVLMLITVCFIGDIGKALMEAHWVLSNKGVYYYGLQTISRY